MPTYNAPVQDTLFLLNDVFRMQRYSNLPGFADATPDIIEAILSEGARFCQDVLQPLNRVGDVKGCTLHDDGSVSTPTGYKEAYKAFADAGWMSLASEPDNGGQGLPGTLNILLQEYVFSANMSWGLYPLLTQSAVAALLVHGSDELKAKYVPNLTIGKWLGTMNLTESHAGTDLGLIKTKAVPQEDGSYRISGQKIFISAGEHDFSENIIHLVLARIEGAPAGTKGISMFLVPKFMVDDDGTIGTRNNVSCGSLEDKMGIHGNSTCMMHFDGAAGWLVGEKHRGLAGMFVMMNEARLSVGVQGLAQSEVAYQNAVSYAQERVQGRARTGAIMPDQVADPLIVHPDIRRTLLDIKSFNEAARALVVWTSLRADQLHRSEDQNERKGADDHLGLMTPIIKCMFTDKGFENTVKAQQVFGGHGYIAETGMEQFVRDARIAMIYEGANGIQALDLVGRKMPKDDGRAYHSFINEIKDFLLDNKDNAAVQPLAKPFESAIEDLELATKWLTENAPKNPDNAGAVSTEFLHLMGLVALGYMWVKMAKAADEKRSSDDVDPAFLDAKLLTAQYFMERQLPETKAHLARITSGADTMMKMPASAF